jgi:penicillin amidase
VFDAPTADTAGARVAAASDGSGTPGGTPGGAPGGAAARDALLARTLTEAVAELTTRFGADPSAWRYGQARYRHALLRHPLTALVDSAERATLDVGPLPRGGGPHTLNAVGTAPGSEAQSSGASLRIVVDLADWDSARGTNTPGQSGDPRSPFYANLFAPWVEGRYFPVPFTRAAVERRAAARTRLVP